MSKYEATSDDDENDGAVGAANEEDQGTEEQNDS